MTKNNFIKKINLKKILKAMVIIVLFSIVIKFSIILTRNTVLAFISSDRFHNFLINRIEFHLVKYIDNLDQDREKENVIVENNLKKIIIRWKPTIDKIYRELGY